MEQEFKLSKFNKIYFAAIAVLSIVSFVAFSDKTLYQIGYFTGGLVFCLLGPLLFAWIAWRLSGRKVKSGSITFNVVLTLILLGQIGQLGNNLRSSQAFIGLLERQREFKKEISNADDPAEIDTAYNKFTKSVKNELNSLSEKSTGSEKQFYEIMGDWIAESQATAQDWNESYDAVLSPRILDLSLLNSDKEFDYQRNILKLYVEKTKAYNDYVINMIPGLKKRLSVLGEENELAKGAIEGASDRYLSQKPILEPLLQAHIEYGGNMIQVLDLLQKHNDMWIYENDELSFYSNNVLNSYNELIEMLGKNEATIQTLSRKMIE